ncbi:MAG TPA: RiPP maturation radical SAM C-methyltransferase [Planctomycetota bacterium]|nr:RiPP maturation radical SAM C-methyltransferase [Planctomycetota bacterium]
MTKIALITMPAQELERPSLSLTQLKARVREVHGDRAEVSIAYLNHDFARFMAGAGGATGAYATLCANQHTGLPDWLFRSEAWPELPDNSDRYFARYYPGRAPAALELRTAMLGCRARLGEFLDAAIETHALDRADVVGFTSMFAQNVASFALARRLKQRNPGVTIVMGGANCESPMGQELVRNVPAVDYVFSGPALLSFPEFVGHLLEGRRERCATIPGVVGRDTPAEAAAHPIGAELPIDEPVALDYADYFASVARNFPAGEVRPVILFETSRGCWWGERSHCTFCGLNGATMSYRSMRPDGAVALINSLFERYRDRSAVFFSVDNILPQAYVSEVLPRLRTPQGATIFYEVKANLGERELSALAAAGVRQIQPGIEALSTSTLKLMRKGSTAFVNLRLLLGCVRHGIEPVWNLLVGFPGEGEEVYRMYVEQLGRLVHLWPPQGVAQVRYDRYSPYHQRPQEWGLKLRRFDFYPLIYPFSEESLEQMAYFFMDENYEAPYLQALSPWMGKLWQAVQHWRSRWQGRDGALPPALVLQREGAAERVIDTRSGRRVERDVSGLKARLLEALDRPRLQSDLESLLGVECATELAELDEWGLIWREDGRALSLVEAGPANGGEGDGHG